jgi:hypothetical protein
MEAVLPCHPLSAGALTVERGGAMAGRNKEAGKGELATIVWLAVVAAIGYAAWNVAPAYVHHYALQDKMQELTKMGRSGNTDQKILDALMKTVREEDLDAYVHPQDFTITTADTSRRMTVNYDRELKILPGMVKIIHFEGKAEGMVAY